MDIFEKISGNSYVLQKESEIDVEAVHTKHTLYTSPYPNHSPPPSQIRSENEKETFYPAKYQGG